MDKILVVPKGKGIKLLVFYPRAEGRKLRLRASCICQKVGVKVISNVVHGLQDLL